MKKKLTASTEHAVRSLSDPEVLREVLSPLMSLACAFALVDGTIAIAIDRLERLRTRLKERGAYRARLAGVDAALRELRRMRANVPQDAAVNYVARSLRPSPGSAAPRKRPRPRRPSP